MTDGVGVYEGQETELLVFGQEGQVRYTIDNYPARDGVQTLAISGNHDTKHYKRGGVDPVRDIANERKDITFLGQHLARMQLSPGVSLELLHPNGKTTFSISIQSLKELGNQKSDFDPDILICGHYHYSAFVYYNGLYFLQAPCFKDYGILDEANRMNPVIGYWMVEVTLTDDLLKIQKFRPTPFTFDPREKRFILLKI